MPVLSCRNIWDESEILSGRARGTPQIFHTPLLCPRPLERRERLHLCSLFFPLAVRVLADDGGNHHWGSDSLLPHVFLSQGPKNIIDHHRRRRSILCQAPNFYCSLLVREAGCRDSDQTRTSPRWRLSLYCCFFFLGRRSSLVSGRPLSAGGAAAFIPCTRCLSINFIYSERVTVLDVGRAAAEISQVRRWITKERGALLSWNPLDWWSGNACIFFFFGGWFLCAELLGL